MPAVVPGHKELVSPKEGSSVQRAHLKIKMTGLIEVTSLSMISAFVHQVKLAKMNLKTAQLFQETSAEMILNAALASKRT